MFRTIFIILTLSFSLLFQSCAGMETSNASSKEEINELENNRGKINDDRKDTQIEDAKLKRQIDLLRKENKKISEERLYEVSKIRYQNKLLYEQIGKLKEENQRIRDENSVLTKKINPPQPKREAHSLDSSKPEKDIQQIKIKVLSGDGKIKSAIEMSNKLRDMGYRISKIDSAPRSDFMSNTIYFAPSFQDDAKQLAPNLGNKSILRPLNWSSIFNLIVVTGKNP